MKVLVVGNGGREHAIVWKLANDSCRPQIYCVPGNGGTAQHAKNVEISANDVEKIVDWCEKNKPDLVILAAAKVGGILANKNNPVVFLLDNMKIQNNLIEAAWKFGVKRFLFLGSSCIYPKLSKQPIKEEYLLSDSLESTNQWYALAKISGIKLCEAYNKQYDFDAISLMPTNLYGPKDNYNLESGHVMAALIRKFYEAKKNNNQNVICWGTGKPLREFLYVDDFAEACLYVLENWHLKNDLSPKDSKGNSYDGNTFWYLDTEAFVNRCLTFEQNGSEIYYGENKYWPLQSC